MLTEIAFTPAVFDEAAHEDKLDWRDQLREFLRILAPHTSVSPVVISNMYDTGWFLEVKRRLMAVEDQKLKPVCQNIILKMEDRLVLRPKCNKFPFDDLAWCREAIASHAIEPIDRIVGTRETRTAIEGEFPDIRSVDELEDVTFWHDIRDRASPEAFFEDQILLLRKMCVHAKWIAFSSPYATTSEMDFTIELLKAALDRPAGFGKLEIEIHFDNWNRGSSSPGPESERKNKQDRIAKFIASQLKRFRHTPDCVSFLCWEKLLERTLIAGDFTTDGNNTKRRRPRWGISMTHVARKRRPKDIPEGSDSEEDSEPHRWRLMDKQELAAPFNKFLDHVAPSRPVPSHL